MLRLALALALCPAATAQLSLSVEGTLDITALGFDAVGGLTFDARSASLWVCDSGATTNDVVRLDPVSGAVLAAFDASAVPGLDFGPDALTSDPSSGDLFLWSAFQRDVAGVVTPTGQLVTAFASSQGITGATFDDSGDLFAVSDTFGGGAGVLHQVDPATGGLLTSVPLQGYTERLSALTFEPQTGNLFAYADETDELLEVDATTGALVDRTSMLPFLLDFSFPTGMDFDATGERLYIGRGAYLGGPDTVLVLRRSPIGSIALNCNPANPNSGFLPVVLDQSFFTLGALHLEAVFGPPNGFGFFLVSSVLVDPGTPVSDGLLCLGAPFGRYAPSAGAGAEQHRPVRRERLLREPRGHVDDGHRVRRAERSAVAAGGRARVGLHLALPALVPRRPGVEPVERGERDVPLTGRRRPRGAGISGIADSSAQPNSDGAEHAAPRRKPALRPASATTEQPGPPELATSAAHAVMRNVREVVSVPDAALEQILVALLAGGHVLIEGIPGTGKTLLSRAIARSLDCEFKRIQFTNDLMPSDIVGSSVWRAHEQRFEFVPGPLFANIVLADEVNRTSSRTLSCLLEAMEEGSVSVDGRPVSLGAPFAILATRNPIEFHGTFPIPEAALDRFLVRVELGYPDADAERALYGGVSAAKGLDQLAPVLRLEQLRALVEAVHDVRIAEVTDYAYRVVAATRRHDSILLGVSPRAAVSWVHAARAAALMQGRAYVVPDDLKHLAVPVLGHRVFLKGGGDASAAVAELVAATPVEL